VCFIDNSKHKKRESAARYGFMFNVLFSVTCICNSTFILLFILLIVELMGELREVVKATYEGYTFFDT